MINNVNCSKQIKLNNEIALSGETDLQVTAIYYAADIVPQGKTDDRFSFDFGLKRKVFEGKGEIVLAATDLFNTFSTRKTIYGNGFTLRAENYYETQVVTLGMKYKF